MSSLGIGVALAAAIPALAVVVVSLIALRGTAPAQRPEIIRALAELIGAARRERRPPRRGRAADAVEAGVPDEPS
ncbi:hypothetical protein ACFFSW_04435 [Saccharothrix longispora]|uniref:Uncharacterized protein n=1 Tax=Saccharothrix longispora TaxID=33920 RepID=A0ABU1PNI2_9PSEU|nr:hypothetical protein [Saccharothrix longispora]MDR6592011.1 hypothetical protein [Saccharothrix longispora]